MKDNFSSRSDDYARYRPTYPDAIFKYLEGFLANKGNAWDCGTGNGQVASKLAFTFDHVYATDISQAQLGHAIQSPNIHYSLQPAEQTDFPGAFFDLIAVGQAIHWFDSERFYAEVRRTARKNALLVILGYGRIQINPETDHWIDDLYTRIVGKYWDPERSHIETGYQTVPFPFEELPVPQVKLTYEWTLDHLKGYLRTWSAVKHYFKIHKADPVEEIWPRLTASWGKEKEKTVNFPLLARVGKIN